MEVLRNECSISDVILRLYTVTDILSCTSLGMALVYQRGWLSLGYLRVYNAHVSLVCLVRSSQRLSVFKSACLLTFSKFVTLMTISAATMFLVETLGDIAMFDESSLRTHNETGKEISFFIMLYYSFVTISTVGYGDIYPESGLGRILVIVVIFGGILFFTKETSKMLELTSLLTNGKGSFKSMHGHAIVCGGGVDSQNLRVFGPFLEELCHPSRGEERPQILLVSGQLMTESVQKKFLKQWWAVGRIKFLQGSMVRQEDMVRMSLKKASMVFVIADVDAEDEEREDERNLTVALAIRNRYPKIALKVMLLKRESKKLATTAGIPPYVCYSNQNLEGLLLINSCRAPGIAVIIANMIKQEPMIFREKIDHNMNYVEGLKLEINGVLLKQSLHGLTYKQLALELYRNWEIVLVGLMTKSGFHCSCDNGSPIVVTDADTVAYLLPRDKRGIDYVSRKSSHWDEEYNRNLVSILKKRKKMQNASNILVSQSQINFHTISSFRSDMVTPQGRRTTMDLSPNQKGVHGCRSLKPLSLSIMDSMDQMKNHILILAHSNRQWEMIHVIARNIRQMQTTFRIKVVILCPHEAPESIKKRNEWVTFVIGDPCKIADLTDKTNVTEASRIILLSPSNNSEFTGNKKQLMRDQKVVFVASILEQEFKRIGRSVPTILEFNKGASHKLLPEPFKEDCPMSSRTINNSYHIRSGQIVLVSDLLRVLASSYYTPGVLEIMMNLLNRGDFETNSQALWAVTPYYYARRTFGEVYEECLQTSNTICFAIYRMPEAGQKQIPFLWTLPPKTTILTADDVLYVMATKDWIMENRKLDIVNKAVRKIQRATRRFLKLKKEGKIKVYHRRKTKYFSFKKATDQGNGEPATYQGYLSRSK